MPKISIIVPVRNVEKYIDRCMISVTHQTFDDIEILIIVGKSDDGTYEKCLNWMQKDHRVSVIEQRGGRLGTARNMGLEYSSSEIIAFIDGDDWWDLSMLEKAYAVMQNEKADMVMCDRYNIQFEYDGSNSIKEWISSLAMCDPAVSVCENPNLIQNIEVSVNGKLYKKSIFTEYGIWQPDVFGEDRAIMHYLVAKCRKIGRVQEALYYYHSEREGNSVGSANTYFSAVECMEHINGLFAKNSDYVMFPFQLAWVLKDIAAISTGAILNADDLSDQEKRLRVRAINQYVDDYYPDRFGVRYIWGSYSLRKIAWYAFPQRTEKRKHYCYSSIISEMSEPLAMKFDHVQAIGEKRSWLENDVNKTFRLDFHPNKEDVLLIDFLEERLGCVHVGNTCITNSYLTEEIYADEECFTDEEINWEAWEEKCMDFFQFLLSKIQPENIVLVKMKFTQEYGTADKRKQFDDLVWIRRKNKDLQKMYSFVESKFKGIKVIDCEEDNYFYTDEDFEYGCFPWHMNQNYYIRIAEKIYKSVQGGYVCLKYQL